MIHRDTMFTNVALTADDEPWWEGRKLNTPVLDWQGKPFDAASGGVSAHPNSRFTVSAKNNPIYSPRAEDPHGRADLGASCSAAAGAKSRRWCTKRATGSTACWSAPRWPRRPRPPPPAAVGVVRRDPDGHEAVRRLQLRRLLAALAGRGQERSKQPPKLFHVNWFRRDAVRQVPVAGFRRQPARAWNGSSSAAPARSARGSPPIGYLPNPGDLNLQGADVSEATMQELLAVTPDAWREEAAEMREYLKEFGERAPAEMSAELAGSRSGWAERCGKWGHAPFPAT